MATTTAECDGDGQFIVVLSSFISVVVLLLARGASPAGRSSLRQTSDNDDTTTNRPSPSHSAVVVVASSSPPRVGHFRPLYLRRQWLSAGGGLSAGGCLSAGGGHTHSPPSTCLCCLKGLDLAHQMVGSKLNMHCM